MSQGAFDDLPFQGQRLPLEDDSAAGDWAVGYRILREAGAAPPWIESDKKARRHMAELDALIERAPRMSPLSYARARAGLRTIVAAANAAVERLNSEAPTDRQHRRPLDLDRELAPLEAAFGRR